ncbi:hypothetical protein P3T76_007368 [Phytophthora citrophthora]|uniref:Uncharacterized protein n=1 Tax=Phytophthora citrophthora TaxID=4793 RepID=A0AAD9GN40_9STRA|nr:hypothetical protein P3T76_007368 [Phytophthora citrophthora]
MYRPLKATVRKNLRFVRFGPRPGFGKELPWVQAKEYEGLVAGITRNGILCGIYLVKGEGFESKNLKSIET